MFFRKDDDKEEIKKLNRRIENLHTAIEQRDKLIGDQRDVMKEQGMTIECLKEVVISVNEGNADYRTRLFNLELKAVKKPRKTTKK